MLRCTMLMSRNSSQGSVREATQLLKSSFECTARAFWRLRVGFSETKTTRKTPFRMRYFRPFEASKTLAANHACIMLAIVFINAYLERGHKAAFHPDGPVSDEFRPGD